MDTFNKNERQAFFASIKGRLIEMNDAEHYCSITLLCGHENPRLVNLCIKKPAFDELRCVVGDKVSVKYFIASRKKVDRWYTSANVLEVLRDLD